jgi:hypothetical protein
MGHRAHLQNLRTSHSSLREELTKQLLLINRKKKWAILPNHLVRLRQIATPGLDAERVTQELLRVKFYFS